MSSQTLDPMHMTPEQYVVRLKADYDRYEKLVKLTGRDVELELDLPD